MYLFSLDIPDFFPIDPYNFFELSRFRSRHRRLGESFIYSLFCGSFAMTARLSPNA